MNRQKCKDIDECKEFKGLCRKNVHCTNTIGSYTCGCWYGYQAVASGCNDIDECENRGICPENSNCLNFAGNYTCKCDDGYQGRYCADIDECSSNTTCHTNALCSNTDGSFMCSCNSGYQGDGYNCKKGRCDDRTCSFNQKCVSPTSNQCECKEGFEYTRNADFCQDIDECLLGHSCDENSTCTNSEGSYSCFCKSGFVDDGENCREGSCSDDMCPLNQQCVSPTKLDCRCKDGFELQSDRINGNCVDIDECLTDENDCDEKAECINETGGYNCSCQIGYLGNGTSCFELNECDTGEHNCHSKAKCINTVGSFSCLCEKPLYGNGTFCSEYACPYDFHNCHINATCEDTKTGFKCPCKSGFVENGTICSDIDECTSNSHKCNNQASCANTIGSYTCSCDAGSGEICESKWFLVLNSFSFMVHLYEKDKQNAPLIIDGSGLSKEINFKFGKRSDVAGSCSIVWHGEMYLFGGKKYWSTEENEILNFEYQISVVQGCKLQHKYKLKFPMSFGACTQRNNTEVIICFELGGVKSTHKTCRHATGPLENFSKMPDSIHEHGYTRIAATSGEYNLN